jgi:hypothetical protein
VRECPIGRDDVGVLDPEPEGDEWLLGGIWIEGTADAPPGTNTVLGEAPSDGSVFCLLLWILADTSAE